MSKNRKEKEREKLTWRLPAACLASTVRPSWPARLLLCLLPRAYWQRRVAAVRARTCSPAPACHCCWRRPRAPRHPPDRPSVYWQEEEDGSAPGGLGQNRNGPARGARYVSPFFLFCFCFLFFWHLFGLIKILNHFIYFCQILQGPKGLIQSPSPKFRIFGHILYI